MIDIYEAGYLPDDMDCDQDTVRFHLSAAHDFYSDIAEQMEKENGQLREQLAKANGRIAELEGFCATYEREFKAVAKWAISMQNDICEGKYHNNTPEGMIYSESVWVDCRWQDVTDPLFTSHEEALNKFAIESEIKGLKDYQALCGFADCRKSIDARIKQLEEQLRKGGE